MAGLCNPVAVGYSCYGALMEWIGPSPSNLPACGVCQARSQGRAPWPAGSREGNESQGQEQQSAACALFPGRVLAEYCPKLRSLKVKHCHNVAESSLSILRNRGVELDVEPPMQRALVLLQDVVGFAPFINLQI